MESENYEAVDWLEAKRLSFKPGTLIEVIGCPGSEGVDLEGTAGGLKGGRREAETSSAEHLLPSEALTITRGTVVSGGALPAYDL